MSREPDYSEPETFRFEDDGTIPNNPKLPVLLYRPKKRDMDCFLGDWFEKRFRENDWTGCWRNGVYSYHHYHSNAHEVLAVYAGNAELQLGGEKGKRLAVKLGDVIALPAGTGHKRLDASSDFAVVGAYPGGADYDLLKEGEGDLESARERIRETPLPEADPIHGPDGPLGKLWQ